MISFFSVSVYASNARWRAALASTVPVAENAQQEPLLVGEDIFRFAENISYAGRWIMAQKEKKKKKHKARRTKSPDQSPDG